MNFKVDFLCAQDVIKEVELDRVVYGSDIEEVMHIDTSELIEWDLFNFHKCLGAKDSEGNLLGYLAVYHLREEVFYKLSNKEISEKDLKKSDFVEPIQESRVFCYICGFVVKDQNTRVAISLLNKAIAYCRHLKQNNVLVMGLGATAISAQGTKLCKKLGFKYICTYNVLPNGFIPELYMFDLSESSFSILINSIKEIFLENDKYL